jgi:hypothetical protein
MQCLHFVPSFRGRFTYKRDWEWPVGIESRDGLNTREKTRRATATPSPPEKFPVTSSGAAQSLRPVYVAARERACDFGFAGVVCGA